MAELYPCPCCGYLTLEELPGSFEICPICFWEDDIVQLAFPDLAGGANECSLIEGQGNFALFGACERRSITHVHAPREGESRDTRWRPLDPHNDRYLRWGSRADHDLWQAIKEGGVFLYYWLPEYWLRPSDMV
ncbi:MAG: CPCC family cysteine-rich protein [Thermoguttaceae bacterium]|jgi:hypothetical protein